MTLCLQCRRQIEQIDDEDAADWQYRTVDQRCDNCNFEYSHERLH